MAKKSYLKAELQRIQKGESSIADYLQRIKSLSDSLAAINNKISELDLVTYTLNGLSIEYGPFVTTHRASISTNHL
jgi:gag-polypeptide of LTR copia-type